MGLALPKNSMTILFQTVEWGLCRPLCASVTSVVVVFGFFCALCTTRCFEIMVFLANFQIVWPKNQFLLLITNLADQCLSVASVLSFWLSLCPFVAFVV